MLAGDIILGLYFAGTACGWISRLLSGPPEEAATLRPPFLVHHAPPGLPRVKRLALDAPEADFLLVDHGPAVFARQNTGVVEHGRQV